MNGVPEDAIKLSLFEFSLKGEAKCWLQSFPPGFFTSWDSLITNFLAQFFPPDRYNYFRAEISCFKQREGESITEAWKRFKSFLRKCPHHGFTDLQQLHIFYNGLNATTRALVDASAGGSLRKKSAEEAREIIETMASNRYDSSEYFVHRQAKGVMELGKEDALLAQNKLLTQQIEALTAQLKAVQMNSAQVNSLQVPPMPQPSFMNYEYGTSTAGQGGLYEQPGMYEEMAQVNLMGNVPRTIPYNQNSAFNSYNPQLRNHPNLSYKSDNYLKPPQPQYQSHSPQFPNQNQSHSSNQPPYNNQKNYYQSSNQFHNPHINQQPPCNHQNNQQTNNQISPNTSNLETTLLAFMKETQSLFKNQDASIRNLETQIGQLSKQISERPSGSFPSDTIPNPKEHCNAIVTKSEGVLGDRGPITIPCSIADIPVGKALIDTGASVNLMPLSMLHKLPIHEVQPITMPLQLADGSVKTPVGVVKDLPVRVEQLLLPTDFVIIDMKEDEKVPVILGRPFLAAGRVLIDVDKGEFSLRKDKVTVELHDPP